MIIEGFIWLNDIIEKNEVKHNVSVTEVESLFDEKPIFSKIENGRIKGENLYRALGQTHAGRYLTVFFIHKSTKEALVISARDMSMRDRRHYAKRKK
ncbi:MAG: BrnT family toxin [Candidatus Aminicenantes bacterium]|nr:BrnT family toxin [Candidatus Aminicenantes bacterium]